MSKKNYRYTITDRLGNFKVEPLGEADFKLSWSYQDDGKSYYKEELPSKILFVGDAFRRLYKLERSIYRCDYIPIMVERRCVTNGIETWAPWFAGRIALNDGDFDLDRCTIELKLSETQLYSCFEDNKGQEINVLDLLAIRRTVSLIPPDIELEFLTQHVTTHPETGVGCGGFAWEGPGTFGDYGWAAYHNVQIYTPAPPPLDDGGDGPSLFAVEPSTDTCDVTTMYARQVTNVPCGGASPGPDWIAIEPFCLPGDDVGVFQKYAKPASIYNCQYTYPVEGDYNNYTMSCQVIGSSAGTGSGAISAIDNGVPLADILSYFVSNFCGGMIVKSDFFQINPDVVTNINYVTNQISKVDNIIVFQKSDVKRPTVSGNATIAKINWEQLLKTLITMFNTTWRITYDVGQGANVFRIEHVKYFDTQVIGLDLTIPRYAEFVKNMRRYSYDNPSIPREERFTFMENDYYGDFPGLPIVYNDACVTSKNASGVKNYPVEKVTTDVQLCLSNPDPDSSRVSDDGFVFVSTRLVAGVYRINSEAPILGGSVLNNSFAWAQLHRDYHRYNRPLKRGNMNGQPTDFITVRPTKKGVKLTVPLCCGDTFEPDKKVKTALGIGTINKAEFSFKSDTIELELLYQADADLTSNTPPVAGNDIVTIYQGQTIDIDVLANDSDADPGATITAVEIVIPPSSGTATVLPNKKIRYVPNPGFNGQDMLVYRILDDWSEPSNNALVVINVNPTNTAPVAGAVIFSTLKNVQLNEPAPGALANSTDDIGFVLQSYTQPANGIISINPDGALTYTPNNDFTGQDLFTFTLIDDQGLTATGNGIINVRDPNAPVANTDNYTTSKDITLTVAAPGVKDNDTTTIGSLSVIAETKTTDQGGTVAINADGSFTYTPPLNYLGMDSFDYDVTNGTFTTTGLVKVKINPPVYIDFVYTENSNIAQIRDCPIEIPEGPPSTAPISTGGFTRTGTYHLYFYQDGGKTVPYDTTGLGMTVQIHRKQTDQAGNGDPIFIAETDEVVGLTGFDMVLFTGAVEVLDKDCNSVQISYYKIEYSLTSVPVE